MIQLAILQVTAEAGFAEGSTILFLLALVFFIFLNGIIAQWKGYPFWIGSVSGIVLFLGTILFLIMPFNKKTRTKCPYCIEHIAKDAKKCKHCGEWLGKDGLEDNARSKP
ncbi:putative membrane protein YhdT [Dysgonomonadaceae bacterium PH5-43]|nr:putative membrane protein YhdT [Dysgonomonadaceae bacterium PH5-43]